MRRVLTDLVAQEFDLLVIGAGAFGAAAAWDATLRGLRVALIDQGDFGGGTSPECFKMVHGGIRYLQHGDLRRLRASCHERSALLRIAPHLVRPLPIVIPTYGHGRRGKAFLGAGLYLYDALTLDRNLGIDDPDRRVGPAEFLSRQETLGLFPDLPRTALTGGAVFRDGQMYNAARLVLAFVKAAANRGATVTNYVQATSFLWKGNSVGGVTAIDRIDGLRLDIRARLVLNAAGPWAEYLIDPARFGPHQRGAFSRDAYFVVRRAPRSDYALAVSGSSHDRDTVVSRGTRHLFAVPWRNFTLIGVWHRPFESEPETAHIDEPELESWIAEMNSSHPGLSLRRDEISYACCGLVPFGHMARNNNELSFGKESRFIDHRKVHGISGVVSIVGIRFTTARGDAARALNLLLQQSTGRAPAPAPTARTPLAGGDIAEMQTFRRQALNGRAEKVSEASLVALLSNHGSEYRAVMQLAENSAQWRTIGGTDTLAAEVAFAAQEEMAVRLADVVLRRTDLGSGSHPGRAALEQAATIMQDAAGWSTRRRQQEIEATQSLLSMHHARTPADAGDRPAELSTA